MSLLASDERRVKILEDGEARARRAYDDGRLRYNLGIDDITAVLAAEETWQHRPHAAHGAAGAGVAPCNTDL